MPNEQPTGEDLGHIEGPAAESIARMVRHVRARAVARPSAAEYEVAVVGAGVVGCAIAKALADQGRRVLVVERDLRAPNRIVGELGQPAMIEALHELGLEQAVEDIDAVNVRGYGLLYQGQDAGLEYPVLANGKLAHGVSFHHGNFITALRNRIVDTRNVELCEATALELTRENQGRSDEAVTGLTIRIRGGSEAGGNSNGDEEITVRAGLTIVCDGCHSRFRARARTAALGDAERAPDVRVKSHFVGAIIKDIVLPYDQCGNVFLIKPSPVLMYQIGSSDTRVLVDVPGAKLPPRAELVRYLTETVAPQLPEQVRAGYLAAVSDPDALSSMPCQSMTATPIATPGVFLVGDALNMRNPLTGGGMTVGIRDAVMLRDLWAPIADLSDRAAVDATRATFLVQRRQRVSVINVLASALYDVFSVKRKDFDELREACFLYLAAGGVFSAGPVGFLSGLNSSPSFLVTHFFAVAVYGTVRVVAPAPSPRRVAIAASLLAEAAGIMLPLLVREGVAPFGYFRRLIFGNRP
jgi:squalene monooxygenase